MLSMCQALEALAFINTVKFHQFIPSLTLNKDPNNKQPDMTEFTLNEFI